MSEKRGYPNPDYEDEDVMIEEGIALEDLGMVAVDLEHYEDLVVKAARLDLLAEAIRKSGKINDDIVRAITGTLDAVEMVPKKTADDFWSYYRKEQEKTEKLKMEVASLKKAKDELIEILRQNNIGDWGKPVDQVDVEVNG